MTHATTHATTHAKKLADVLGRSLLALFVLGGCAGEAATQEVTAGRAPLVHDAAGSGSLARSIAEAGAAARGPVWIAWDVPSVSRRNTCCFDRRFARTACMLEERDQNWGTSTDSPPGSGRLQVLARWSQGAVEKVFAVDAECAVDAEPLSIVRLPDVDVNESVHWLASRAADEGDDDSGGSLAALAYHAGPAAMQALQRLAAEGNPEDLRGNALFWIGQTRGEEGARFLAGIVRGDSDPEIREKAIFAISQNDSPLSARAITEAARSDREAEVRAQALFWLAQTKSTSAEEVLLVALDEDPSQKVREQAVFAMTQLPDGGVPLLVRIARDARRDKEVRRQAMFWLGQSKDSRALDFLEEILE